MIVKLIKCLGTAARHEFAINAILKLHKSCMISLFNNATKSHNTNHIRMLNCGQTMRNSKDGAFAHGIVQRRLNDFFRLGIKRT